MAARKAKLIGIEEAAHLFGKSVHQMRQYKSKGLLKVADCNGNKDLFNMAEVILLKHLIRELRVTEGLSLAQISRRLDQSLIKFSFRVPAVIVRLGEDREVFSEPNCLGFRYLFRSHASFTIRIISEKRASDQAGKPRTRSGCRALANRRRTVLKSSFSTISSCTPSSSPGSIERK